jgi:tetratricopeptide (TPR) repeat protein
MRDQRLQGAAKLLMSGQRDQAEALLQTFVQEQPQAAEAWHLLGLASLQAGQHAAALHRLQQAVRLGPQIADHHYNLAGAYYALKRWQEAATSYQTAADLGSNFFEAWKGLGASLLKLGTGNRGGNGLAPIPSVKPQAIFGLG